MKFYCNAMGLMTSFLLSITASASAATIVVPGDLKLVNALDPNIPLMGQVVTFDTDSQVNSYTFRGDDRTPVTLESHIWSYDTATNTLESVSSLYSSGDVTTTNNGGNSGFEDLTFNPAGLNVTAGTYLFALEYKSSLRDFPLDLAFSGGGIDTYAGGSVVVSFGSFDPVANSPLIPLAFDLGLVINPAEIQPGVPEPSTWLMMLAGFALTGFALKRRKIALAA